MDKKIFLGVAVALLLVLPIVLAVDFVPQGDINLKDTYYILNDPAGSCDSGYVVGGRLANGSWNCTLDAGSSGVISGINTTDNYLLGGCESGTCNLSVNETYLNSTISTLDTDTDTWWSIITTYLYNNSGSLDLNETKLNETINALDDDTTYDNGTGIDLVGTTFSHEDTSTQASSDNSGRTYIQDIILDGFGHITGIVTATETVVNSVWSLTGTYLYNNSGSLALNETKLNATIDARDEDTTYTAGDYLSLDGTEFNVDESALNTTIDARDDDTTYSDGSGIDLVGTTFSHEDTSTQSSSDNSGRTYIQDIILDTYGHITSIVTATETVTDSIWGLTGDYLYNNSGNLDLNETKLNLTISALDTDTQLTQEQVQDYAGEMAGDHLTYTDVSNDLSVDDDWYDSEGDLPANITRDSEWDTQGKVETVWGTTLSTDSERTTGLAAQDECSEITNCVPNAWDANADISANEISESKIDFDTVCGAGSHLYISGDNLACEADDDTTYTAGTYMYLDGTEFNVNETALNNTYLDDTTIGNCSDTDSCSNIIYETELDTISELNSQIADATVLISGGTLTSSKWCVYDGTGIDCNVDPVIDTTIGNCSSSGDCSSVVYLDYSNAGSINVTDGNDICIEGGNCLSDAGVGSGDITAVNTNGDYLTGGSESGAVNLLLNETELNATIDARDSDTTYTAGTYLYLDSTEFNVNETTLNATIDARDADTTYTAGSGLDLAGTTFSHEDTSSQSSSDNSGRTYIQDIVLDTYGHITSIVTASETVVDSVWALTGEYIYNNSGSLDINETKLNATIDARDDDTQLTQEQVTDYAGGMWTGNTETGIAITFQDADNTIDAVVDFSSVDECTDITNCVPNAWDAIGDVPTATPSNGDTTHLSTADQIYDWAVGLFLQSSPFGASIDDTEMTAEDFGEFTCSGDEDGCTLNSGSFDDEYIELGDTFGGDVSGTYDAIVVSDDSHNHVYSDIDAFTEANLYSILTDVSQFYESGDAATFSTVNTGHGANELYSMNQDVETTDGVTFATVNTGQGANELYAMNQDVETTDGVTFATVNTGQGANELYDMDQNVQTTDNVQFNNVTSIECITFDSGGKICSGS